MQKLLVTISYSDGYNYSSEKTLPVIFDSKEEFIITLEDRVNNYVKEIKKFDVEHQKYNEAYEDKRENYSKLIKCTKLNDKKPEKDLQINELIQWRIKEHDKLLKSKPPEIFNLGGQQFNFNDFIYREEHDFKDIKPQLPRVETLEEFFKSVDNNLKSNKIKP